MSDAAPSNPGPASNTTFDARNAEAYEQTMGRWSRRLAPLLIHYGGLADGDRLLDVGCGTGSLALTLPDLANVASVTGIDQSEVYIKHARGRTIDPRFHFQQADACALPFGDASFDRTLDAGAAVHPGRYPGGRGDATCRAARRNRAACGFWTARRDAAYPHDMGYRGRPRSGHLNGPCCFLSAPGELADAWRAVGLVDVQQTDLLIRLEYSCFDDYWLPITAEGPVAQFTRTLSDSARATLEKHVRRAYCANRPEGPRSFATVAWACRGTVPR